jgi:glycine C-acetyltransferase
MWVKLAKKLSLQQKPTTPFTMADIFERLIKNYGPIGQHRERAHGYFAFPKLEGEIGSRMMFRGKEKIVWSLNNYLGLANHPEVRKTYDER